MKQAVILFISVLLTACAVHYEQAAEKVASAPVCCASMADLPYEPVAEGQLVMFDLGAGSPAYGFATGKSYFKALRLPERATPYRVKIRSYALGERIDRAHVFYPRVLTLDENFEVITDDTPVMISARGSTKQAIDENKWGMPARIEGELLIDGDRSRYLVIRTTDELRRSSTTYVERVGGLGAPAASLGLIPQGGFQLRHSPVGRIVLEIGP